MKTTGFRSGSDSKESACSEGDLGSIPFRELRSHLPGSVAKTLIEKKRSGKNSERTSQVAQWLRICLPMQGTWFRSLVQEDATRHRPTKLIGHYRPHPEPVLQNKKPPRREGQHPRWRGAPAPHSEAASTCGSKTQTSQKEINRF